MDYYKSKLIAQAAFITLYCEIYDEATNYIMPKRPQYLNFIAVG